jgi:hypothetical protein
MESRHRACRRVEQGTADLKVTADNDRHNPWLAIGGFPTSDHRLVWVDTRLGGGHDDDY